MTTATKPLTVLNLSVSNYMGIEVAEVALNGKVIEIAGPNGAGKSSFSDALWAVIFGSDTMPEKPLREGEKRGRVTVDFGSEGVVEVVGVLTLAEGASPRLELSRADGSPIQRPREFMDKLTGGGWTFDPEDFALMRPADQRQKLMELVGLDFTDLDAQLKRLETLREAKFEPRNAARHVADQATFHDDAPETDVDVSSLQAELQKAQEAEIEFTDLKAAYQNAKAEVERAKSRGAADIQAATDKHQAAVSRVADLEKLLEKARAEVTSAEAAIVTTQQQAEASLAKAQDALAAAKEAAQNVPDFNIAQIRQRLAEAGAANAKVAANRKRAELLKAADAADAEYKAYTDKIEALREEKAKRLAAVEYPVPGLGFTDHGVTLNGVPFAQGSDAQRIIASAAISLAIATAGGARLKIVRCKHSALLDEKSTAQLIEICNRHGAQLVRETPGSGGQNSIVFEAGKVKGAPEHTPVAAKGKRQRALV